MGEQSKTPLRETPSSLVDRSSASWVISVKMEIWSKTRQIIISFDLRDFLLNFLHIPCFVGWIFVFILKFLKKEEEMSDKSKLANFNLLVFCCMNKKISRAKSVFHCCFWFVKSLKFCFLPERHFLHERIFYFYFHVKYCISVFFMFCCWFCSVEFMFSSQYTWKVVWICFLIVFCFDFVV